MKKTAKPKFFYGWVSAAVCFLIVFAATGAAALTFNIFTIPVTEHYGISRTGYSITVSLASVISAVCYFCYGPSVRKIGVKRSIIIGLCMYGLGLGLFASGLGVWTLYAKAVFCGIAGVFISSSVLTQIINNWFVEKRGLLIGIICAASGIGGSVFSPILGAVLEKSGWQTACLLLCFLVLFCVPVAWLFLSIDPGEKGSTAYGSKPHAIKHDAREESMHTGKLLKDYRFWLITLAVFFINFSMTPSYNNVTPHLIDSGFAPLWVTGIAMVVLLISNAAAKPVMGILNDRFGVLSTILITCILCTAAPFMMSFAGRSGSAFAVTTVALLGFGTPVTTVVIPLVISRIFPAKAYNTMIGLTMAAGYIGTTLGTPISNYIYDTSGSYRASYWISAVTAAVTLILMLLSLIRKDRRGADLPKTQKSAVKTAA